MEVRLDATEHAVNVRKRGGSLIVRIPFEIASQLNVKEGQLALILINKEERIISYRFLHKKQ